MKFRGFLKKGNIKRKSNELSISDPGSDDSWDLLCKDDESNGSKPTSVLHDSGSAASSSIGVQVAPVKDIGQTNGVVASMSTTQTKTANISMEFQANTGKNQKEPLPFTSTPFVSHKQTPMFEFSPIISPVDELATQEAQNESGTILVLNRKNSAGAADDTFSQLLKPGKNVVKRPSRELGVRPLKSLINQGDTTRQYAGGVAKGRVVGSVNPSSNDVEDSWETTEASPTCTTELKKTSHSPDKIKRQSQEPNSFPHTRTSKSNLLTDRTSLQDENKALSTAIDCNSPRKLSRRSQSVLPEVSEAQKMDNVKELNSTLNKKRESQKGGAATHIKLTESGGKSSLEKGTNDELQLEENQQNSTVVDDVEDVAAGPTVNNVKSNQTSAELEKISPNKTVRKSIIIDHTNDSKKRFKKRVSFSDQTKHSEENSALCVKSKSNVNQELVARSHEPEIHIHEDKQKKTRTERMESNETNVETPGVENIPSNPVQVSVNQDGLHGHESQTSQMGSDLAGKGMNVAWQSNFAVKIGNSVLTQASCFHMVTDFKKNNVIQNDKVKDTRATPGCVAGKETVKETSESHIVGPANEPINVCKIKARAEEEVNAKELHSSPHKRSSVQQNKTRATEFESSSEEENILLRAQSLKLRENQNHSSRNSKSLKIADSGQLGLIAKHNNNIISPCKSPVKSLACENVPVLHTSFEARQTIFSGSQDNESNQPQVSKPEKLNTSADRLNLSGSSCEVFISRQPQDCQSNLEDNFHLEIMSTSEDEEVANKRRIFHTKSEKNVMQSHKPQNQDELLKPDRPRKASRLSLKTKETRRRRREEIEKSRKSHGTSSGSDSPSPHPHSSQKKISRRDSNAPSSRARKIDDVEKCKKKLLVDDVISDKSRDSDNSNAQMVVDTSPVQPSTKKISSLNSKREVDQNIDLKNASEKVNKPKRRNALKGNPSTTEPVLSQNDLQSQEHEDQRLITDDVQLDEESGKRCSQRSRKPPSMYWLCNRARIEAGDCVGVSGKQIPNDERNPGHLKRQKRKIDSTNKVDKAKQRKKVKQIEQNPVSPRDDPLLSHPDEDDDEVLMYDTYAAKENEVASVTCMPLEVKTTPLVWGVGVKGDLLSLGAGAKCEHKKKSTLNQVFYVLEGKINYTCAQKEKVLTTGSVFIVAKGQKYTIKNLGDSTGKLFVTHCSV